MKTVLRFLKPYIKQCVLAPLFKLLEACFELAVPLVVASVIDVGILGGNTTHIYKMFVLLLVLGLVGLICAVVAQFFSAQAAMGCSSGIRSALFRHIQSFGYSDIDSCGSSALITRITSDVTQVQTGVNLTLRLIMRAPFVVFGAVIMAFTVDSHSALVFCVCVPLLLAAVFAVMLGSVPMYRRVQAALERLSSSVRSNLAGVRVIRAFAKEQDQREEFAGRNSALFTLQRVSGYLTALLNPGTLLIVNLSVAVLIYTGALRVQSGVLSQGEVVALYNYMAQILTELVKMANLIITMTKAVASAGRIDDLFAKEPVMKNGTLTQCGDFSLTLEGAALTYPGTSESALTGVDLHVQRGQTVGIIGATGSGKSTLISLIARFYDATQGRVLLGGKDIREYDTAFLRRNIAIVPQHAVLFSGTVRENILAGIAAPDSAVLKALERAQGLDIIESKEGALDARIEQGGANLSGGQRQRLTIARALVREPKVLILDDSSSALDYATDAALRKAIGECDFSPTVITVSQRTSAVMHADKILVLDDGEVVGAGTHSELLGTCEVYKEIYDSQFEGGAEDENC